MVSEMLAIIVCVPCETVSPISPFFYVHRIAERGLNLKPVFKIREGIHFIARGAE